MSRLQRALFQLDIDLRQLRIPSAVIGGLAVSVRAEPRTTRDLDISVTVRNDSEAESIVRDFWARGYRLATPPLEQLEVQRLATVRFLSPGQDVEGVVVDLLFASSGIEPEIVAAAEPLEVLPDIVMPVATIGHLLALKTLASRAQDVADIHSLLQFAKNRDIQLAYEALALISKRGFDRGKDLEKLFMSYLKQIERS